MYEFTPVLTPPDHTGVQVEGVAEPISVTVGEAHVNVWSKPALAFGRGLTVIDVVAVFVHPFPSVPVTEYVADVVGVKATPSLTPPDQV